MNWNPLAATAGVPNTAPKRQMTGVEREAMHRLFDSFEIRLEQIAETIRRWKADRAADATGSTLCH